jgi:hypothetical protein
MLIMSGRRGEVYLFPSAYRNVCAPALNLTNPLLPASPSLERGKKRHGGTAPDLMVAAGAIVLFLRQVLCFGSDLVVFAVALELEP